MAVRPFFGPRGVMAQANDSLIATLRHRATGDGVKNALQFLPDGEGEEIAYSYADLDRVARRIGAALQAMGAKGERVLLLYAPGIEYVAGFWGALYAGAIAVPVYPPDPSRLER